MSDLALRDPSFWARPDAPPPVRAGYRTATPDEVAEANRSQGRSGASRFLEPERAIEMAGSAQSAVPARLESWLEHPDERVALALLDNRNLRSPDDVALTFERASADALREEVLWSAPLERLFEYSHQLSRRVGQRWDDLAEQRKRCLAEGGVLQQWLEAQTDPARGEVIAEIGADWLAVVERHGVLSDGYVRTRVEEWLQRWYNKPPHFLSNPRLSESQVQWLSTRILQVEKHAYPSALRAVAFGLVEAGHSIHPALVDAVVALELSEWPGQGNRGVELGRFALRPAHVEQIVQTALLGDEDWTRRVDLVGGLATHGHFLPSSQVEQLRSVAFAPAPTLEEGQEEAYRRERTRQGVARGALLSFPDVLSREDLLRLARAGVSAQEAAVLVSHPQVDAALLQQVALRVAPGGDTLGHALLEHPEGRALPEVRAYAATCRGARTLLLSDATPQEFADLWPLAYASDSVRAAEALVRASPEQRGALTEVHWRVVADDLLYVRLPFKEDHGSGNLYRRDGRWTTDSQSPTALQALVEIPSALEDAEVQRALLQRIATGQGIDAKRIARCLEHAPAAFARAVARAASARTPKWACQLEHASDRVVSLLEPEDLAALRESDDPDVRTQATLFAARRHAHLGARPGQDPAQLSLSFSRALPR
jgi:hypothetical protein